MVEICHYMGWDYYTYGQQPVWFIECVTMKMREEARAKKTNNHGR